MNGERGRFLVVLYLPSILSSFDSGSVVEVGCSKIGTVVEVVFGVVVLAIVVVGGGERGW